MIDDFLRNTQRRLLRHQSSRMLMKLKNFLVICTLATLWSSLSVSADEGDHLSVDVLLSTTQTIIGQPITYPEGQAKITAAIVKMEPGQRTGWHQHNTPLFGYILEGELTVDYGPDGQKTYRLGDSLVDAMGLSHNGSNSGDGPLRILLVFAGSETVKNTVRED
ncbi:MAG: cupin domain-containing protein [Pseudomonadota bacterium]